MTARILVVDDIMANVKLLEARLAAEYFDVITAMSGPEAIEVEPELRIAQSRLRHAHLDRYTAWVRNARARRGGHAWAIDERATARAIIALLKDALTATYEPAAPRTRELARATWYLLFGE